MRVWVTRAQPQADETAARLRALGHTPLVEPLLEVRRLDTPLDLEGVTLLAFTSRNGVAAFAARETARHCPVTAVGDATAEAARAAGFSAVASARGDVTALADLIIARSPEGLVLHAGAAEPAGDLAALLASAGVVVRSVALYDTTALRPPGAPAAWLEADAVLIHSPKAARALRALDLPPGPVPRLLAISEAAAAPLRERYGAVEVAARPDEAALLERLVSPAPLVPEPPAR